MSRRRPNDACWCGSGRKLKRCHAAFDLRGRAPVAPGVVAPILTVPEGITRPPYIITGTVVRGSEFEILSGADLDGMRVAGRIAAEVLVAAGEAVAVGITTAEIDRVAHQAYIERGSYPSTLGYRGFTKSVCTSVNEVACHGIPDTRPLQHGDIVNIDVTAFVEGFHGDTSATFVVGECDISTQSLINATVESTYAGIAAVKPGAQLRAIGTACERVADHYGFGVVRDYGGHGIGRVFHGPHVHHTDVRSATMPFVPGMCFTVEPMLTAGTHRIRDWDGEWDDGWTVVSQDGLPGAQFEHTVVVTDTGVEILTVTADGGSAVEQCRVATSQ